jgi:sensor c-di-GMP phosphodiesterase-like protein
MVLAIAVVVGASIFLALRLSRQLVIAAEKERIQSLVEVAHFRAAMLREEVVAAFEELSAQTSAPCAEPGIDTMRRIALGGTFIQAVVYLQGRVALCSSDLLTNAPFSLPRTPAISLGETNAWIDVSIPHAPRGSFILLEHREYFVLVKKAVAVGIGKTNGLEVTGLIFPSREGPLAVADGALDPQWLFRLMEQPEAISTSDEYIAGLSRLREWPLVVFAVAPLLGAEREIGRTAWKIVPVGILGGLALAVVAGLLLRKQTSMAAAIKRALERNELFLVYQPAVDLNTGAWVGAEILVRWRRTTGEMVPPDSFVPVAEASGLIKQLTRHVFDIAAVEARELFRRFPDIHLGLNLSSADLHDPKTLEMLETFLARTGAPAGSIVVEATERGLTDPVIGRAHVSAIRKLGIQVAVDDFGTGYSSLAYLERFELDWLKIDRAFVGSIGRNAATSPVIESIITMGRQLGLRLIAEGVETPEQADYLRNRGVAMAQGYLFSRPLTFEHFATQYWANSASQSGSPHDEPRTEP